MRLHSLAITAFGPYQGRVEIDLDALAADGLFLLHGDTGVGKTTILDAVAFALYGTVPGPRGEAKRLRCDSADPHTRTEIELELTVGGSRLRIVRSPDYLRPKARGDGLTKENGKAVLVFPEEPERSAITGQREVGDLILELLGMSADQFFQVVLLPQGEFARFLRADTADRERLLERLFDTRRFADIEEAFALLRRESGQQVRSLTGQVETALARVEQACGTSLDDRIDPAVMDELLTSLADRSERAVAEAESARRDRERAEVELTEAEHQSSRLRTLTSLLAERAALDAGESELAALRQAIDDASRAEPVRQAAVVADVEQAAVTAAGSAEHLARREVEVIAARCGEEAAGPAAEDLFTAAEQFGKPVEPQALRAVAANDRDRAGALAGLVEEAGLQDSDLSLAGKLRSGLAEVVDQLTAGQTELGTLPGRLDELTSAAAAARAATAELDRSTTEHDRIAAIVVAAKAVPGLRTIANAKAEAAVAAVDAHQAAREERLRLTELRFAGMAAELAGDLHSGDGCPVCGATEHPHPADAADAIAADLVTVAQQREAAAGLARERAEVQREVAAGQLAVTLTSAQGLSPEEAAELLTAAADRVAELTKLAATESALQQSVESARTRITAITERRQLAQQRHIAIDTELQLVTARIQSRRERLQEAAIPFRSVGEKRDQLLLLAGAREDWASALDTVRAAGTGAVRSQEALKLAVEQARFDTVETAMAAATADSAAMSAQVRAAEDRRLQVTARLADPQLAGLDPSSSVDVAAAGHVAAAARRRDREAVAAAETANRVAAATTTAVAGLRAAVGRLAPVAAADADISALADTIAGRGQNHRAISLRTYVLATRLRQVAVVAGERLRRMSAGRFSFVPSTGKESRGRSGGLGLDILDDHTGTVRSAKTLSGGESFLASLALALGLADVVAAESGGRVLDTIFVDEGFGTLDADTLDLVMDTLDDLRAGGRTVGLVSHVDDLRQRIPTRLHIRRTPTGPVPQISVG